MLSHVLGLQRSAEREVCIAGPCPVRDVLQQAMEDLGLSFTEAMWNEYAILVDGREIRYLSGWDTPVAPDSTVSVVPPRAGG